jgi:hypothetical protein
MSGEISQKRNIIKIEDTENLLINHDEPLNIDENNENGKDNSAFNVPLASGQHSQDILGNLSHTVGYGNLAVSWPIQLKKTLGFFIVIKKKEMVMIVILK